MWRETVERKPNTCNTTKQRGWSGTDDKGKDKPGTGKGKGKQDKGKGKGKNKNKGKGKHHGKKGKNEFHEMEGHDDAQDTQTGQHDTEYGRTRVGITLTTGLTQTGDRGTGAQICGLTVHGNKRHDICQRHNLLKNTPIQCTEAAFQC